MAFYYDLKLQPVWKQACIIFGVALAFYVTGKLGLMMFGPDGNLAPFWPPAGISVAAILLLGPRSVIGVFCASLILSGSTTGPRWEQIFIQSNQMIAVGNALLPLTANYLLRKYGNYPNLLYQYKDILKLYIYGGIIPSIVPAVLGTIAIFAVSRNYGLDMLEPFLRWWVRGVIGITLLTPLILVFVQIWDNKTRVRGVLATVGILISVMVCLYIFFQSRYWMEEDVKSRIETDASIALRNLENSLIQQENTSAAVVGILGGDSVIEREDFDRLADQLIAVKPDLMALGWNEFVPHENRAEVESAIRSEYGVEDGFTIAAVSRTRASVPVSDNYIIARFLFPVSEQFKSIIGSDLRAGGLRDEIDGAIATGKTIFTLVNSESLVPEPGLIVFMPVFNEGRLKGFAGSIVAVKSIIVPSIDHLIDNYAVQIINDNKAQSSGGAEIIHDAGMSNSSFSVRILGWKHEKQLDIYGQKWRIVMVPKGEFLVRLTKSASYSMLLIIGPISILIGFMFLTLTGLQSVTQEQVNKRTNELEKANRAKTDFMANMSHEIRTPLTGIKGMVSLARDANDVDERQTYLELADSSVHSMLDIVNDILDMSRIEKGQIQLKPEPNDLGRLVDGVASLLKPIATSRGLELNVEIDEGLPTVMIDGARIRQVVTNLVSNALKFTPEGQVAVSVELLQLRGLETDLMIKVVDTGIGIAKQDIPKVFERFRQLDNTRARKYDGAGLGLAISRQLIDLMGGRIWLESEVGVGTSFFVTLTLRNCGVASQSPEPRNPYDIFESKRAGESKKGKILVAEDNPVNQLLMTKLLSKEGYQAVVAENGLVVLDELQNNNEPPYDIVLMDIQMPKMDGLEALKEIRKLEGPSASIPVVAVTANAMPDQVALYEKSGMDDFIPKPIDAERLFHVIEQQLKKSALS